MSKYKENFKYLLNIILPIFVVILLFRFLPKIIVFFAPLILAFIIAVLADRLISFLYKKYKFPRKYTSIISVILIFVIIVLVISLIAYGLYSFISDSLMDVPDLLLEGNRIINITNNTFSIDIPSLNTKEILAHTSNLSFDFQNIKDLISASINNVANVIVFIAFTLIFSYVILNENENIVKTLNKKLPKTIMGYITYIKKEFNKIFYGWFKAQIFCIIVISIILIIGFLIINIKFAIPLAILIALVDALPIFGSGLFLWPWAIISLLNSEYLSFIILCILYAMIQIVRNVIQNRYMQVQYQINGVATLIIIFLGYKIYGFIGLIFSLPIGMFVISLYKYGIFDDMIYSIKMLFKNIKSYLKISKKG